MEASPSILNMSLIIQSSGWPKRVMDISLAQKMVGYNPNTSLKEGLQETWEWFLKNEDEYKFKKNYFKDEKIKRFITGISGMVGLSCRLYY